MLPYHTRAQEGDWASFSFLFFFFLHLSMALFGFDEIQIRLTLLLWNLVSGADSGNYLLCKLQPAATDEQRISVLCCRSTTISPPAPPPSPLWVSMLQMKIIHFPCTIPTGAVTRDRLGAAQSPLIFLSTMLIIVEKLHPPSHYLNWKLIIL